MVEMLPMVQIVPELNLALNPATGELGASLGKGMVLLSMDEINQEIAKMEIAADELMNSLDPFTAPADSYPGREGAHAVSGTISNMAYGFALATLMLLAIMPLLVTWGVL